MYPPATIATTATFLVSIPAASAGVRAYRAFGGLREISCPETMDAALVRINVTRAIASRLSGGNELRLKSCLVLARPAGLRPGVPLSDRGLARRVPRSRAADEASRRTAGSVGLSRPAAQHAQVKKLRAAKGVDAAIAAARRLQR